MLSVLWMWLLSLCGILGYIALWRRTRRIKQMVKDLPCYPPLPIIGNAHQILGDTKFVVQLLTDFTNIIDQTGKPFFMWIGPVPFLVFQEPEDIKAVTCAFVEKPYYYSFARDWVGNGLVTAPGNIWKNSIKKLSGTFTGNIVDGYQQVFSSQAQKFVNQLKGEVGKEPFDVLHKYLALTTLETICQTALGVPEISENIVTKEYYQAFTRTFELLMKRGFNLFTHPDWIYKLTPAYREFHKCIATMQKVSNSIIAKRLKERDEQKRNGTLPEPNPENGAIRFKSFLEILLEMRDVDPEIDMQWVSNEVDTIIVGGQETTATTLCFALILIGSHKHVQDRMYKELKEIFGDSKRPVQKEDLAKMVYTEAVILETLRLYPPVPFIMREADRDLKLASCTIPRGASCGVLSWGAGRSARRWAPDPLHYRPERWLHARDDLTRANPATFLAFSYGKRACIGRRYAIALIKTILATLLRELEVSSELDKLVLKVECTLKAATGGCIAVRHRQP